MERPASARARSAALLLPLLGLFLLMPPLITLFAGSARPAGVPLVVLYLFGVWLALVLAAAWMARRLDVQAVPGDEAPGQASAATDRR